MRLRERRLWKEVGVERYLREGVAEKFEEAEAQTLLRERGESNVF